jgi:MFS family permease
MDLFRHSSYIRFWCARLTSGAASQILMLAISWHMYRLTGSAWDLGLVGLLQFAPAIVMTLPAGHAADRFHRVHIAQLCQFVQALAALMLTAATIGHWDSRSLLFGLSVVLGAVRPLQMASMQALMPALVPFDLLPRAAAFSSAGLQGAIVAGPAIGGLLFAAGLGVAYGTCCALFVVAALILAGVHYQHSPPPREPVTLESVLAGIGFIRANQVLLGAISLDLFAVLLGGATALLPIYAEEILHVGPQGLGLLRSSTAVGALLVALTLARRPMARHVGKKLLISVAIYGLCIVVFGISRSFWLSLLALTCSGGADMVSVVVRQTLVQIETPDAMRGRVAAVNSLFIGASNQLGEFESGATAALMGPVASVLLGGLGTLAVAAAWMKLFKGLAARDRFV